LTPRKALIIDPSARHRLRVTAVLGDHPALTVVGAVGSVGEALKRAERNRPDLVVIDADFGGNQGLATLRQVIAALPDAAVWVLTDQGTARGPSAREAFRLGVQAWLVKPPLGVDDLRSTLYSAADTLLTGTRTTDPEPVGTPSEPVVRPAKRPVLKAVPPGTGRVRASAPAPPPEPMHGEPRASTQRPVLQTPMPGGMAAVRPLGTPASSSESLPARALGRGPDIQQSPLAPTPGPPASASHSGPTPPPPEPPRPAPPRPPRRSRARRAPAPPPPPPRPRPTLIVMGASTGGEEAIALVVAGLPPALDVPVVVIQDMPDYFLARFADRLHSQGPLPAALAVQGEALLPGRVWVVPGNHHLEVQGPPGAYKVHLRGGRRVHGNRPSVDVTLTSLVRPDAGPVQVVILTGTGRDGADGAKALLPHGAHVLAQDKATSVVYGMPGAVQEDGTAHLVLPLQSIPGGLRARLQDPPTL